MIRAAVVCAAVLAASFGAAAENYPLTFKAVTAEQISKLPGGYGAYGNLQLKKPAGIRKEPKTTSSRPLYGETRESESGSRHVFRLDESKGDGKGYDRLIVDMNQNGDLTDDGVAPKAYTPPIAKTDSRTIAPAWFGPLLAPAGNEFAGGRAVFFAHVYLRTIPERAGQSEDVYAGYARLKAGWYLESTVDVNGRKQTIAVYDGNGNLRLGDPPESRISGGKNWYFQPGDAFFVDIDRSGTFVREPLDLEARPFGPMLYLDGEPYKARLDASCTSLRLDPWTELLAEVSLGPNGEQVRNLSLAWEHPAGKWQLLNMPVEGGKVKVPPGRYRLYFCAAYDQFADADPVMASANQRAMKTPFKFESGKANVLRCGAPLEAAATASKATATTLDSVRGTPRDPERDSEYVVRISTEFRGADGEVYSSFAKGPKLADQPQKPVFKVFGADGKQLAKGNLEFG